MNIAIFIAHYTIGNSPSIINFLDFLSKEHNIFLFLYHVGLQQCELTRNNRIIIVDLDLNTIDSIANKTDLLKKTYGIFVAFDPHGFVLCKNIFPNSTPFYYSLELYLKNDHFGLYYPDYICRFEREHINSIKGLIIQSSEKDVLFRKDYNLNSSIPTLLLPVTCRKNPNIIKTCFIHDKYNIPKTKKIALHLGGIARWFSCIEIASVFSKLDDWVLVFHGHAHKDYETELLDAINKFDMKNIVVSSEVYDDILDVDKIVSSSDIGIAWYTDISEGFRTAGFSSGKIASYLQFGLPVITKRYASTIESIEQTKSGICINNISEIPIALKKIQSDYFSFSNSAQETFEKTFNFEKYTKSIRSFLFYELALLQEHKPLAPQSYWNTIYEDLKLTTLRPDDKIKRWILNHIPKGHGSCIEIGAFPGRYLTIFGELGYKLHGIDLTPRIQSDLPGLLNNLGFKVGNFIREDFLLFEFNVQYDIVCSFGFIEHFSNWEQVLLKHASLVKKDGYLVIETPNFYGSIQQQLHSVFDKNNLQRHNIEAMRPDKWSQILEQNNFDIIFSGHFGGFDFWSEDEILENDVREIFDCFQKVLPILKSITIDSPNYSPYCGLIARKLSTKTALAKKTQQVVLANTNNKIHIACTHFWPSVGGVETVAAFIGEHLVKRGFSVDVATLANQERTCDNYKGINIISLDTSKNLNNEPNWVFELRDLITSGKYSACILLADPLNMVIWSIEEAIIPEHTKVIIQPVINQSGYSRWKSNAEFKQRLSAILKKATMVLALTETGYDSQFLREEGIPYSIIPNAAEVLPTTFDFRRQHNIAEDDFVILHVANLWQVKNHIGILEALDNLPESWKLVMIGYPDGEIENVQAINNILKTRPEVIYVPGLPPEGIAAAMESANVVILASHGEVAPIAILEAMGHSIPWLATPACGLVNELSGGIVSPLSNFKSVLNVLYNEPVLQQALGTLGYWHWSVNFNSEYVGEQWVKLVTTGQLQPSSVSKQNDHQKMKEICNEIINKFKAHNIGLGLSTCYDSFNLKLISYADQNLADDSRLVVEQLRLELIRQPGNQLIADKLKAHLLTKPCAKTVYPSSSLITVIIPFYKQLDTIPETLNSLTNQTYRNFEVVLVNDGDTEEVIENFRQFAVTNPDIQCRYHYKNNTGLADTRNFGVQKAKGRYILPLDSDDMIATTFLEEIVKILDQNKSVAFVYTEVLFWGAKNEIWATTDFDPQVLLQRNLMTCTTLYRKEIWAAIGGYNTNMNYGYEDWDFWISAVEKGFTGTNIHLPLFIYRRKAGSMLERRTEYDPLAKRQIIENHPSLYKPLTDATLHLLSQQIGLIPFECLLEKPVVSQISSKYFKAAPTRKILFVCHDFPPYKLAGAQLFALRLAQALQADGYHVAVLYPVNQSTRKPGEDAGLYSITRSEYEGIPVHQLTVDDQAGSLYLHPQYCFSNTDVEEAFRSLLQTEQFDIVHFHLLYRLSTHLPAIAKEMGAATVATLHDYWLLCAMGHLIDTCGRECSGPETAEKCAACLNGFEGTANAETIRFFKERLEATKAAHETIDMTYSPSAFLADCHAAHGFRRPQILPLGWMPVKPAGDKPQGNVVVFGYLGQIIGRKGLDLLLAAVAQLVHENWELRIYGEVYQAGYFEPLYEYIQRHPRIHYCGPYKSTDLERLYAEIDVAVVPSRRENYPLTVLEALSAQVPVVATNVGGVQEIMQEGLDGFIVPPQSPDALKAALERFLINPALVQQVKATIRPIKSIQQNAKEYETIYKYLLIDSMKGKPV